ncbi:MAG TPA: PIG-L family deacetylase [Acidimicrobiales bacterium]|nr:PIG-L family deacetylase [Acidimicrobiales bacterium]
MAPTGLTLMAVHAHPDDEATGTGGTLARYADEGIATVLVTCTDGSAGDGPGGVKPGQPGHDPQAVSELRRKELGVSCRTLGVEHLELLGYRDSGVMGWSTNDAPGSFWTTPVEEAAERLVVLLERYRPQVVVTYDANGFYGHPDHIQAHRVTMAAVAASGIGEKVYFPTVPRSRLREFAARLRDAGVNPPFEGGDPPPGFGAEDHEIAAWIDVSAVVSRKWDALAAHASQRDTIFMLDMGKELFMETMAVEPYLRAADRTGSPTPEYDLFAGLR